MIPDNELLQHEVCALGNHHFLCPSAVGSWQDLAITIPMVWDHSRKNDAKVSAMSNKKSGKVKCIITHTQASNVLQFINVDCTTLMSWELYRSTPPWLDLPGRHDYFFNKCLHPKTASPLLSQHPSLKTIKTPPFLEKSTSLEETSAGSHVIPWLCCFRTNSLTALTNVWSVY